MTPALQLGPLPAPAFPLRWRRVARGLFAPSPRALFYIASASTVAAAALVILPEPGWLTRARLAADLDPAVVKAIAQPEGGVGDPTAAMRLFSVDPTTRAREALYLAALQRPDLGRLAVQRVYRREPTLSDLVDGALSILDAPRLRHDRPARAVGRRAPASSQLVNQVVADAAAVVGVDQAYLTRAAQRESSWNIYAASRTSSARGLFQFIEQTWLKSVADYGALHGLSREARLIRFDRAGRAYVVDPADRARILALRYDPTLASRIAAELTAQNVRALRADLGRLPSQGELYAAHVLGAAGASRLIRAAYVAPYYPAARLLPEAAGANRRLFFRGGRALSAWEVLSAFS
ncbi:transglycosylase SLT domain-containing protein [Caulobacter sp. X]|uniref:transglycosylase SLT domain-containing protein n=1 Tax=Caulobacter sp. X TaxID=2048901 RepID=UPI000C15A472|nr:transglycosylase SLT domain-containing protein [Caulobacter sp. X]PIB95334.1 hypothetical protein CSW60_22585 [Caulobacter sp. X]